MATSVTSAPSDLTATMTSVALAPADLKTSADLVTSVALAPADPERFGPGGSGDFTNFGPEASTRVTSDLTSVALAPAVPETSAISAALAPADLKTSLTGDPEA